MFALLACNTAYYLYAGTPSKGLDAAAHPERGFVFYTNLESAKGAELLAAPKAALCFHWKSLRRQVRVVSEFVAAPAPLARFVAELRGHGLVVLQEVKQPDVPAQMLVENPRPRHRETKARERWQRERILAG